MFFTNFKDANMYAKLETIKTHYKHKVVKCKKYARPWGDKLVYGYTVILR